MTDAASRSQEAVPDSPIIRAALYLRVSTNRQAEHDLSIPDQRRQAERYCEAKG
ncbi:recombinase family protein [Rhodophyticola porphyridii]|uniref:recombinase family protein n=1 Tax=Rhodophyticola porphyridii TaxID=1852017 RepID=UPI0035CF6FD5